MLIFNTINTNLAVLKDTASNEDVALMKMSDYNALR